MENEEVVEVQKILTEAEIRTNQIPELNADFCMANGIDQKLVDRFWKKIDFPDDLVDGCWNWTGYKDKYGFGTIMVNKQRIAIHRFSYMIFKGYMKNSSSTVKHICDNNLCVNPAHLLSGNDCQNNKINKFSETSNLIHGFPVLNYNFCDDNNINSLIINRFWKKIDFPKDLIHDCWNWNKYTCRSGYGNFRAFPRSTGKPRFRAHVFSYKIFKGNFEKGLEVRHTCDNPACVNPAHLLIGTSQQNSQDMVDRNRQSRIFKLSDETVKEILNDLILGKSTTELAKQHNVVHSTINAFSIGRTRKHIFNQLTDNQKKKIQENKRLLSSDEIQKIKYLKSTGMVEAKIGKIIGVSHQTINNVINNNHNY